MKWQLEVGQCRKMLQGRPVSPSHWDLGAEPGLALQPQPTMPGWSGTSGLCAASPWQK